VNLPEVELLEVQQGGTQVWQAAFTSTPAGLVLFLTASPNTQDGIASGES
jgi:hypothetical protein